MSSGYAVLLLILLSDALTTVKGTFLETPTNQTINVGETAAFRCRHATADFIIWKLNDSLIDNNNLPLGITPRSEGESGGVVYTLSIIGQPEYNGTKIVGVAVFISSSSDDETFPAAILQVSTNTTDGNMSGFIEEPLSLNVTIGEEAVFRCEHRSADALFWRINGTSLSSRSDLNNDFKENIGQLTVTALTKYNNTLIQCVALFDSVNRQPETTASAILKIQGILNRVDSLVRNSTTISWSPPFSLDLTNIEPDIAYCVDVYNITCGGRELLISDCDVTETSYTSDVIAPDGYIYEYIVTPRSNVEGAINGTPSQPVRDLFTSLTMNSSQISMIRSFEVAYERWFTINEIDAPVPSSFTLSLNGMDGLGDMDEVETSNTKSDKYLTLDVVSGLPRRRLWNCIVKPYRCQNNQVIVEGDTELSTHDIQNISVTSPQPGEVRVTGDFIDGSTGTGLLTIISEIFYHLIERGSDQLHIEGSIQGVVGGEHSISFFVVEESGLPFNRTASTPKVVSVENSNDVNHPSIEYSLQSTSTGICITCTFLDSSATDCVAVVHQRISQLSSSGLMNIESSHKFTRSGDTASGCIEGVNMEDYQVGVVGGRRLSLPLTETEDHSSSVKGVIVGIVLGVLVFILLAVAVVVVALIVVRKRKITKLLSRIVDIETSGPPITPSSDDVNQPGNEATVNLYESIPVTNRQESRAELNESADGALEPLLSTPSPPLPTRQGENRVYSDSSSDSATSSENTIETVLSSPSQSSDDRILGDPGPLYDQPQPPGSTDMQPPTDLQHQSNEEESPPPVPLRTEDRNVLVEQSSDPSLSVQDKTSTDIQSPPDPMYAEPQLPGRAPVQTSSSEEQALQSPPPVPPITEDREVLLQGSSGSSPNQGSPHIAVSIDQPPCPDPTYDKPQSPAVNQPPSKEKQQVSRIPSSETCGPTYAQPVLSTSSPTPSLPPVTEPVVYKDVKGFKNAEGQHYAILKEIHVAKSKETCRPDDRDQKPSVYVEIQPHSRGPTTAGVCVKQNQSSDKNTATPETHTKPPFTVENILPALLFMASKWQAVGKALSLDEDLLDEIFTNNETDEACLNVMLEHYMMRSDLKHSWEEIREAMRKVEEKDRETEELEPTSQRSPVKKHLDAGVGLDKCGEMMANELGDVPSTCSTGISHHHQIHYSKPSACESTTKSASSLEYSSKDGKGLTQGYQPNKNDKVSLNMEGLMEFQENCIQDIQGQSSADVLEQQTIKEHTKALDSDVNGNATRSPMSSPGKHEGSQEEINKNESSEGIRPEGPYRTRMDELFPTQLDDSLPCVSSLQPHLNVFPGIKKDQAKKSSQPTDCSVLSDDFDHLSGEQWIVTSLPTSQYHSLETCLISGNKSHAPVLHYSTPCQESSEDKTNYLAAIAKQLNIGRTPFARERKESEHGLFHLRRIPKPCANRKQLRVHKTVCTSSPSDSSQCTFVLTCTDTDTTRHQVCPFQDAGANVTLVNRNSDTMHLFLVHVNEYSRQYNQKSRYLQIYVRYIHIQDTEDRTQIICCEDVYKIILNVNLNLKVTTRVLHVVSYFCNVSYYFYCTTVSFIVSVLYSFLSLSVWVSLINYMYHSFYVNFLVSN